MRKNAKERKMVTTDEMNVSSFFKIIIGILIVLIVFSLITAFVTRDKDKKDTSNDIQYTNIIVGSILNRGEEDYFVLVEKEDDTNLSTYESLITTYNSKDDHLRFYIVLLSDPFNANYLASESNLNVNNINDIRFSETTLLHIRDGKIVSTRVGNDVYDYLNKLSA